MWRLRKWIAVLFLCVVLFVGCQITPDSAGEKQYQLDLKKAAQFEEYSEVTLSVLAVLGSIFPYLLPVVGIGVGALGAWRKVKPKLIEARSEANLFYDTTDALVAGIESFKKTNPDDWQKLEEPLVKAIGPKAENAIRALRGLPPKA